MNRVDSCRVCGEKLSSFMSYGKMPIANGFIKDKTEKEDFFNLDPKPAVKIIACIKLKIIS